MSSPKENRSERFLARYRTLEGLLERRYAARKASGSVVMEYLRDPDSEPCRTELDLCREIRNILAHNEGGDGQPVIEPSEAVLDALEAILEHVAQPQLAARCGTPREGILFAHPNDNALDVMRHMARMGYSHVPVRDKSGLLGVFSAASLMLYAGRKGFDGLTDSLKIGDMKNALSFTDERSEKYLFLPPDATLLTVQDAFEKREERNRHVAAVFITEDGTRQSEILAMLTPWDVMKDGMER